MEQNEIGMLKAELKEDEMIECDVCNAMLL